MDTLQVKSNTRNEWIDISSQVQKSVAKHGLKNGVCLVFVPHTTAAVTINEGADPSVKADVLDTLSQLLPQKASYRHLEGNSDAHIKSSLVGASILVPIHQGKLVLGTWQSIYFCEFDGPRNRRVHVQLMENPAR